MASQNIARLGIVFGVDTAELETKISNAKKQFSDFGKQVNRDSQNAAKDLVQLRYATEDYGKTLSKVQMIEREMKSGRYQYAEKSLTDMLLKEAAAYDAKAASMKKVTGQMTEQQRIQLGYQTTDLFTQIASGQSPLIALIQQGGQLKDVMGGFGNMFRMLASFITPFNVAITATAAIVGTLGYAFYKSREDLNEFTKQIALTGSYADITAGKFADMSNTIGQSTKMGVGDAKDALLELISTGKFTEKALGAVQTAVLTYARVAGIDGVEAAKKLAAGLSGDAAEAKALNDKMNFLTLDQYKYIESLDRAGKSQEAAIEVSRLFTANLNEQAKQVTGLDGLWKRFTTTISNWFDSVKTAMGPQLGSELEVLTSKVKQIQSAMESGALNATAMQQGEKELANAKARIAVLQKEADLKKEAAKRQIEEKQKVKDYTSAGGAAKEKQLAEEQAKLIAEIKYNTTVDSNNEVAKITLDAERKKQEVIAKYEAKSGEEKRVFAVELARNQALEIAKIETEANQQINDLVTKQRRVANDAATKAEINLSFERAYTKASDEQKIELILKKRLADINEDFQKKQLETNQRYTVQYLREKKALELSAYEDAEQARQAFRKKQFNAELDEMIRELRAKEDEQKKIDEASIAFNKKNFYAAEQAKENEKLAQKKLMFEIESFGLSEKQIKLKEIEFQLERDIAIIKMNKENQNQSDIDEAVRLAKETAEAKKETIELADSFKSMRDLQSSVFSNMTSAIDNFVKNGKLSMKDFARSVIQDLLAIQLKAQAMSMLRVLFGMFNPVMGPAQSAMPLDASFDKYLAPRAAGGPVNANTPYVVGEKGPELFMPSGSGTIVPNNKMGNMGSVTNVTNNYINAIDTKSFEDRLLGSSNAIWAANTYANKSLAVNRGRA